MNDLVSVIIPAYNHEKYIGKCIESVLNQTYSNLEVLVNDDCSTDGTRAEIEKINDDRVKKFFSKTNRGVVESINELSSKCNGKYIAIIGSDDFWYPTKIEEQLKVFKENPKLGAVFTEVDFVDENNEIYQEKIFNYSNMTSAERIRKFYEIGNHLCHPSSMIKKSVFKDIGEYNNRYRQLHDYDYWTRLVQKYKINIINKKLMAYRRERKNNESISSVNNTNTMRLYNELFYINYKMITDANNKLFKEAFMDKFKNKNSSSEVELLCEKFFLLINMPYECNNKSYAYSLFFNYKNQKELFNTLEKKFNYTLRDFYEETGMNNKVYPDKVLYDEFSKNIDEKNMIIRNLNMELQSIYNSKSWKITKPIRAIRKIGK